MHVIPEGNIRPCCVADFELEGNPTVHGKTNEQIMNTSGLQTMRKQMLDGEAPKHCRRCYEHEANDRNANSMRKYFFQEFDNPASRDLVENHTLEDGSLDKIEIQYLDIRFGNICNFKCRMCGHGLSSTWYDEHMKIEPTYTQKKFIHVDMYEQLEPFFDTVTEVYFAGGEPLLYPEHYKILEKLIELGRTDVHLKYNTNLSNLDYKSKPVTYYWNQFKRVSVGASIDGFGDTIEYMRTGADWEVLKRNFQRVLEETTNTLIYVTPTIGALNVEMLPEFHKHLYELNFIGLPRTLGHTLLTNYVDYPAYQNIKYLPAAYKAHIAEKFEAHKQWLIQEGLTHSLDKWDNIVGYMNSYTGDNKNEMTILRGQLDLWDSLNPKLNWHEQLPHLRKAFE